MADLRALMGVALLVCGCGADFQAAAELTGGSGPTAGAAGAGSGPAAGSGGSAGSAGSPGTGGAVAGQGGAISGGGSASGGAPPEPACSIAALDLRFLETFTWQDYTSESLGYCEVCHTTPCATFPEVYWTYPFQLEGTTIEADVTIPAAPYIIADIGECGTELTDTCNFKLSAQGYFRFELEPTATGWKVATVVSRASDPDRSPFNSTGTEVCSGPEMNTTLAQDDIFMEFKAALAAQTWECP